MTTGEIVIAVFTIVAIVAGPILAVLVTRHNDQKRETRARKFEIFRTLMRTRAIPLNVDHVSALNLVEVEFSDYKDVIAAWKAYLDNLSQPLPPVEQKGQFDAATKHRDSLLTKLISRIAEALDFKVEQLDILARNYVPQGWEDEYWEQKLVRRHLISVLGGYTPVVIKLDQGRSPFPPPPIDDGTR